MESQVWLITGATRGIGLAIAQAALAAGHRVAGTYRNPSEALAELAAQYPDRFLAAALDLAQPETLAPCAAQVLGAFGRIDVLVNNAGYGLLGALEEMDETAIRRQIEVNLTGLILFTHRVVPHLRAQGSGYIVNVASVAGLRGMLGGALYSATKFGVVGFSESLYHELRPLGIRVSVVAPGPYRTDWAGASLVQTPGMTRPNTASPYHALNDKLHRWNTTTDGRQPGDPQQIGRVLVHAATLPSPPLHLIFGDEALGFLADKETKMADPTYAARIPHGKLTLEQ